MMEFDWRLAGDYAFRLGVAIAAGGALGLEREITRHWAGLRTHMVVSLGAATFVLLGMAIADGDPNASARVLQGVATGVGFLGAGTILKLDDRQKIKGLTTASSIWLAAALGSVAGAGRYELMAVCAVMALMILTLLRPISDKLSEEDDEKPDRPPVVH